MPVRAKIFEVTVHVDLHGTVADADDDVVPMSLIPVAGP